MKVNEKMPNGSQAKFYTTVEFDQTAASKNVERLLGVPSVEAAILRHFEEASTIDLPQSKPGLQALTSDITSTADQDKAADRSRDALERLERIAFLEPFKLEVGKSHSAKRLVVIPTSKSEDKAVQKLREDLGAGSVAKQHEITRGRIGRLDDAAHAQQHRSPLNQTYPFFKRREDALRALEIEPDSDEPERKHDVFVIIVDQGLHRDYIDNIGGTGTFLNRFQLKGEAAYDIENVGPNEQGDRYKGWPQWHGHMIARNILAVAGNNRDLQDNDPGWIKILDAPIVPDRVSEVIGEIERMRLIYEKIKTWVENKQKKDRIVIVNAWGIKDRLREYPQGSYTGRRKGKPGKHPLVKLVNKVASNSGVELVFAAGNAGQFTFDPEAGRYDRGPERSIFGAALVRKVYTAGAVDANGAWLGNSSQGQNGRLRSNKPDVATPSYFRDPLDAHVVSSGTSASCAVMAGLLVRQYRRDKNFVRKRRVLQDCRPRRGKGKGKDKNEKGLIAGRVGAGLPQFSDWTIETSENT